MGNNTHWTFGDIAVGTIAFCFILFVQGTVPFVMTPELLQALWSMGFAQSLANNSSVLDVFARDIGIPGPSAMAFGLAGAYPASLLMRLGMHAADAYSLTAAFWFAVAFVSTVRISTTFGAGQVAAVMLGCTWLSMPIIWAHSGYSMVSWGIALLPFYFWASIRLYRIGGKAECFCVGSCALYLVAAVVAVFMDGYTFMMFATGSTILLFYEIIIRRERRVYLLFFAAPVQLASFAMAYLLYISYIGRPSFEPYSLDFFRGWGVDVAYIAIPTQGILWLPDLLGLSVPRSNELQFGDASVWTTTFFLPLLIMAVFAFWRVRRKMSVAGGVLILAIFGFYMALGPSLKINSIKPSALQMTSPREKSVLMPEKYAVMPTGSAWISENLSGFNVMRASYRWTALSVFALWLLFAIWIAGRSIAHPAGSYFIIFVLIVINMPNLTSHSLRNYNFRNMFIQIDNDLVQPLKEALPPGISCLFAPTGNDFLANYLAPKAGLKCYNIGGDKNVAEAQKKWPKEILGKFGALDEATPYAALNLLASGEASAVIIPHFHLLKSGFLWPPPEKLVDQFKAEADAFKANITEFSFLSITETKYFTIFQLKPEFSEEPVRMALKTDILEQAAQQIYPLTLNGGSALSRFVAAEGWYKPESQFTWSKEQALLELPIPKEYKRPNRAITLRFVVYGANPARPVDVYFETKNAGPKWSEKITATSSANYTVEVPLESVNGIRSVGISVPNATSPKKLSGSADTRVLGIALKEITIGAPSTASHQSQAPITYPIFFQSGKNGASLLPEGWHSPEATHTWSQEEAKLVLPVPKGFEAGEGQGVLKFWVFGASPTRPVDVFFESADPDWNWEKNITVTSESPLSIAIPLGISPRAILIRVPSATSPQKMIGTPDPRIIGIALQEMALEVNGSIAGEI
jgi:hypothetical protein